MLDYKNLDYSLAEHLGSALVEFSVNAQTFPADSMPYIEWVELLQTHGAALLDYADQTETGIPTEECIKDAKQALHWVAEHLGMLWD